MSERKQGLAPRPELNGNSYTRSLRRESPLVYDLMAFIRRFVVMTRPQLMIVALWVIHTYMVKSLYQTPYLAVTSPEKRCGKSRLLEVLELLVLSPWLTMMPTEATLFRRIHKEMPTLLLDEVDAVFKNTKSDRYENLRSVFNGGHRPGATVPRCIGTSNRLEFFNVYCAKVLAGIGTMPGTVADRAVPIRLERRKRDEQVERFLSRDIGPQAAALRERVKAWAEDHRDQISNARPAMPEEVDDRMQEGCESLVAIADALGCGSKAREALVELFGGERLDDEDTLRVQLLADIRSAFKRLKVTRVSTNDLLAALFEDSEAPWGNYYGRGLDARDLGMFLHHFGISSTTVVLKSGKRAKGFKRELFHDAWKRYL